MFSDEYDKIERLKNRGDCESYKVTASPVFIYASDEPNEHAGTLVHFSFDSPLCLQTLIC